MKHVQAIEYRTKTEPPTEPGWYYARFVKDFPIEPLELVSGIGGLRADFLHRFDCTVEDFDFFGPVRIVKEG